MRHNWITACPDKCKIDQIFLICVKTDVFQTLGCRHKLFTSRRVRSFDSSTPAKASSTRFHFPNHYFHRLTHTHLLLFFPPADKTPFERAEFLESTELFADIHAAVATSGQTAVPTDLDTDLHFTCFVQAPESSVREAEKIATTAAKRRLIELDGGRAGPVDRGESVDLLKVRVSLLDTFMLTSRRGC
jgi:hypothetical protein